MITTPTVTKIQQRTGHRHHLALKITNGRLVEIDFRGTRHVRSGSEPFVVEIKEAVDY